MALAKLDGLELPAAADMHVHLRDGDMAELVVPTIRKGGVNAVFVMPNLVPPITTVQHALEYQSRIQALEPNVQFLMSLYLHPNISSETVIEAKKAGIAGIKSYPHGVTTHSDAGVLSYEAFYPVFAEMERQDMVLNLHGELPSSTSPAAHDGRAVTVLTAEEAFLPTLHDLHARFPRLRIVLEHVTTAAALTAVRQCGPNVVATITAHHLSLTVDDWAGDPHAFCKPVAKTPEDRRALLRAVVSGEPKIFFGSDSAPHPAGAKRADRVAAGVFTQPYVVGHVVDALEKGVESGVVREDEVTRQVLEGFLSGFGRRFYGIGDGKGERIVLRKPNVAVEDILRSKDGVIEVVPFRRGKMTWSVDWK